MQCMCFTGVASGACPVVGGLTDWLTGLVCWRREDEKKKQEAVAVHCCQTLAKRSVTDFHLYSLGCIRVRAGAKTPPQSTLALIYETFGWEASRFWHSSWQCPCYGRKDCHSSSAVKHTSPFYNKIHNPGWMCVIVIMDLFIAAPSRVVYMSVCEGFLGKYKHNNNIPSLALDLWVWQWRVTCVSGPFTVSAGPLYIYIHFSTSFISALKLYIIVGIKFAQKWLYKEEG